MLGCVYGICELVGIGWFWGSVGWGVVEVVGVVVGWVWGIIEVGGFIFIVLFVIGIVGEGVIGDGIVCIGVGVGVGVGVVWGVDVVFNWGIVLCCEMGGFCVGFIWLFDKRKKECLD